jgi:hypothetical protein
MQKLPTRKKVVFEAASDLPLDEWEASTKLTHGCGTPRQFAPLGAKTMMRLAVWRFCISQLISTCFSCRSGKYLELEERN